MYNEQPEAVQRRIMLETWLKKSQETALGQAWFEYIRQQICSTLPDTPTQGVWVPLSVILTGLDPSTHVRRLHSSIVQHNNTSTIQETSRLDYTWIEAHTTCPLLQASISESELRLVFSLLITYNHRLLVQPGRKADCRSRPHWLSTRSSTHLESLSV